MSLPISFVRAAGAEFDAAINWYNAKRTELGDELMIEVQQVLDDIAEQPERYPIVDDDVREAPVHRFPYCVYYRVESNAIVVISVFHTARNPEIWQRRK
jgi:plasmid stabilization system protein ParE